MPYFDPGHVSILSPFLMSIHRALLRIILTQLLLPFMCLGAMEQPGQEDATLTPKDLKLVLILHEGQ